MTMGKLRDELNHIADCFMNMAIEQRDHDQLVSYNAFHISDTCRKAAENLRPDPAEKELEGGWSSWWYVCGECRGLVCSQDAYCKHCGAKFE